MCSAATKNSTDLHKLVDASVATYLDAHENGVLPRNAYKLIMDEVERALLKRVLIFTSHNQLKASKILGISRNTLARKLQHHKLLRRS